MKETLEQIIERFPKNISVLDVGCYGHEGVNTSTYLAKYFDHVTGINVNAKSVAQAPENYTAILDNFYVHEFPNPFTLVVLDLTIESNMLNDWSETGMERIKRVVKPGGYLLNFVMMTDQYGDPEVTPDLIRWHSKRFWKSDIPNAESVGARLKTLKDWEVIHVQPEVRRPYILWTLLRRTDGL